MKTLGRVIRSQDATVSVSIEGNGGAAVAACCTVPSVVLEAKNPLGEAFRPGELVEVTDGIGTLALGGASLVAFPVAFYGVSTSLWNLWWVALVAGAAGLGLALLFLSSLKMNQYPRIVRRVGAPPETDFE